MLLWITLAVVVLLYGVIAFFSSRNWQVGHVVLMFAVFLFTLGATILAAMNLKTHDAWRAVHAKLTERISSAEAEIEQLERGSLLSVSRDVKDIPTLRAELTRALIDRGRVWRGAVPVQANDDGFVVSMQGWGDLQCARAGIEGDANDGLLDAGVDGQPAPVAEAPAAHGIEAGIILFVFAEIRPEEDRLLALYGDSELPQRDAQGACRLPGLYLGRFLVTETNEQAIQLKPVYQLSETQLATTQQKLSWALYESMPHDRHDVFGGWTLDQLQTFFRQPAGVDPDRWNAKLQQYARDGQDADQGELDEFKWVEVRFLKETTIDVDAAEEALDKERPFDPTGRATYSRLRQGKPTEFKVGDLAIFSLRAAEALTRNGSAERTEKPPIYRRPLRDYNLILQSLQVGLTSEQQLTELVGGDRGSIDLAIQKAQQQKQDREDIQKKLDSDLANYRTELQVIRQVTGQLEEERKAQRRELSRLYLSNRGLRGQLSSRSAKAAVVAAATDAQSVRP